jgi:hypothetical protein
MSNSDPLDSVFHSLYSAILAQGSFIIPRNIVDLGLPVGHTFSSSLSLSSTSMSTWGGQLMNTFICRICEQEYSLLDLELHTCKCILQTQLDAYVMRWIGIREEIQAFVSHLSQKLHEMRTSRRHRKMDENSLRTLHDLLRDITLVQFSLTKHLVHSHI